VNVFYLAHLQKIIVTLNRRNGRPRILINFQEISQVSSFFVNSSEGPDINIESELPLMRFPIPPLITQVFQESNINGWGELYFDDYDYENGPINVRQQNVEGFAIGVLAVVARFCLGKL